MSKFFERLCIAFGVLLMVFGLFLFLRNESTEAAAEEKIEEAKVKAEEEKEDGGESEFLGIIKLPSLERELPVFKELTEEKLSAAPCLEKGSLEKGDAVIAGHNYKGHFDNLHELKKGEEISIEKPDGEEIFYRAVEIFKINPTEVEKVMESEFPLVIYTCNRTGKARFVFCFEKI